MKKWLLKLFSYKTWTYAAAVVTVLMAFPVVKEHMKSPPEVTVSVGDYLVTDQQTITLLYVVPNNTTIDKFQVPLPISFVNMGNSAIHNFLTIFSTKMLKIYDGTREGYMKRFLCTNESMNNGMQYSNIKSAAMVGKCKIELISHGYELNIVRRDKQQTSSYPFDNFDFNLEITYDNQEKAQNIHFNVLCLFESQYQEMLLKRVSLKTEGMIFTIFTQIERWRNQDDNIKIMKCKLKDTGVAIVKM